MDKLSLRMKLKVGSGVLVAMLFTMGVVSYNDGECAAFAAAASA